MFEQTLISICKSCNEEFECKHHCVLHTLETGHTNFEVTATEWVMKIKV